MMFPKNAYKLFVALIILMVFYPEDILGQDDNIVQYTVFNAGEAGVNTFRIPVIVTTKEGTLIAACEARKESWRDKSPTDIAVKRSIDGGKTWSQIKFVTDGAKDNYAFMDPCLLVDHETGKIFLFTCRWPETPQDGTANIPFLITSTDDGRIWSDPVSVKESFTLSSGYIDGFGPGSGIQMQGSKYNGRLIVPIRLMDATTRRNRAVYSDNNGQTWTIGGRAPRVGEFQIAELAGDKLYYNSRISGGRAACYSLNGGVTWGSDIIEDELPSIEKGCQGSVMGIGNTLLYSGIEGGTATTLYDDRCKLRLFKSMDGGTTWNQNYLLYEKAAGYSCITQLNEGNIGILFEAGDENGFIKSAVRGAGWLRLDIMILPKSLIDTGTSATEVISGKTCFFSLTPDKNSILFSNTDNAIADIYSVTGIALKKNQIINGKMNISDLNKGVYILCMENKTQTFIK